MRFFKRLNVNPVGGTDEMKAGEFEVADGKIAKACKMKITAYLDGNGLGGSQALTAAGKKALLDSLNFKLTWGAGQKRKAFDQTGSYLRYHERCLTRAEIIGYTDSTSGLAQAIASAGSNVAVTWWMRFPFYDKRLPKEVRRLMGVGPTQAKQLKLEVKGKGAPSLNNSLVIHSGMIITIDICAEEVRGEDTWQPIPTFEEFSEKNYRHTFAACFPLEACEEQAVLASTSLVDVDVKIDGREIHANAAIKDTYTDVSQDLGTVNYQDTADTFTPFYTLKPDPEMSELHAGELFFEDLSRALNGMDFSLVSLPYIDDAGVRADVEDMAGPNGLGKTIKLVPAARAHKVNVPTEISAYMPCLVTREDGSPASRHAFAAYSGVGAPAKGKADVFPAPHELQAAQTKIAAARAMGGLQGQHLADQVLQDFAKGIPGASHPSKGVHGQTNAHLERLKGQLKY